MKFLCRNCKAKYQIADEKVAGRTLRMTCQQCGEPIVVRSAQRTGSGVGARPIAVGGGGTGSQSILSADFQRQIAGNTRDIPIQASADEWHVAINDVPVGPMRRDEVARKIALHAVDRDSLAWREGMDDWQPVKHIPELSALFPMAGTGPVPVPGNTGRISAPPAPVTAVAMAPSAQSLSSVPPPPAPAPVAPAPPIAAPPAARVDMAPVGGRQVMSLAEYSAPLDMTAAVGVAVPVPVQQLAQLANEAVPVVPEPAPKQLGWAQMFALVSGGAFILAMGALLGVRVLAPQPTTPAPVAVAAAPAAHPEAPKHEAPVAQAEPEKSNVIELDTQAIDGQNSAARRTAGGTLPSGTPATPAPSGGKKEKELTSEQKEMLARMGGGLESGGPNLRAPSETARPSGSGQGALTPDQLSAVVLRGRKNLQRCYETALRGSGSSDTVRLDVEIEVSPNGNVTVVKSSGKGLPGMDDCITRTVKMWRFPTSGDSSQMRFPVVFQPGA